MKTSLRSAVLAVFVAAVCSEGCSHKRETDKSDQALAAEFYDSGTAWNEKKDYDRAIKDFDEAIRLDPKFAHALYSRGTTWGEKKEYDRAIKDYDEAIRLDPMNARAFNSRGIAWSFKKEYDRAIKDYDEAIHLEPSLSFAFYNRGVAWNKKKEYDREIEDYDEAIRLDPKFVLAFASRGNAWSFKKEYDRAIKDFDKAIRLDPKFAHAFASRGIAWSSKREYDKAIKDFDEAIRLDPKDSLAYFNRSVAQMLVRSVQAAGGFQTMIDIQGWKGDLAPSAVVLGNFAARQSGDDSAAKRFLKDSAGMLAEIWPYPAVRFLRGEIDEAALLMLATDDNQRADARCYLGLDHVLKGHKDEALAHFRWVKEHGNPAFIAYTIAVAELERLERAGK